MTTSTAPIIIGDPSRLDYLDTDTAKSFAADLAGKDTRCLPDAVVAMRAVHAANLNGTVQHWASDNGFTVDRIAYLESGIHITVRSGNSQHMLADAPYDFSSVIGATRIRAEYFTVKDADTDEELEY